ncbi:class I SAM-dependent methyltransferase [Schlesneria paludicola]|uniref:class I SAM-dependent methyltransferase n=1 Tax=Schlesneria paludicola TaxID=360056 RepID=UPI001ED96D07|nr:methyltransferase domain-containing protein [Schlesneria paludicola]
MEVSSDQSINQRPQQEKGAHQEARASHEDHNHHHAFVDPAERAKKWNDPDRDTWQHPDQIVAALALKPGTAVADIGAGTGYMVAFLSQAVGPNGTVIAIDAEAAMIEYLTKRSLDLGPARIVPKKVGTDDPQLNPQSVDGVLTLDTWHHVRKREAYAKKVYEGLKQGGRFVVVDHEVNAETGPPKAMRLAPEYVAKELASVGFRVEVVPESMPRHYMIVGHKE